MCLCKLNHIQRQIEYIPSSNVNQPLEYAPWGDARPYDGGFRYNCMMLQVKIDPQIYLLICLDPVDPGGFRKATGHQPWLQHQRRDLRGGNKSNNAQIHLTKVTANLIIPKYI